MKAFLLHKDRDFDSEQFIVRKEKATRQSRRGEEQPGLKGILPWNAEALRQDLELNRGEEFLVPSALRSWQHISPKQRTDERALPAAWLPEDAELQMFSR
jgi:hypothetical protein